MSSFLYVQQRLTDGLLAVQKVAIFIAVALIVILTALFWDSLALMAFYFVVFSGAAFELFIVLSILTSTSWRPVFVLSPLVFGGGICLLVVDHSQMAIVLAISMILISIIALAVAYKEKELWFLCRQNWHWAAVQAGVVIVTFFLIRFLPSVFSLRLGL